MRIVSVYKSALDVWQSLTTGSINRSIFRAAVVVSVATILVKVVSLLKDLIIASKFGIGDKLDAFIIATVVPALIVNVVAASFSDALLPIYIWLRDREGVQSAQKLFASVTSWALILLIPITLVMLGLSGFYLPLLASGFDDEKLKLTFHLLCVISPFAVLQGVALIWRGVLNAGERFALAALAPSAIPFLTIALVLGVPAWGAYSLAVGLVIGALSEIFLLGILLHRQGLLCLPSRNLFHPFVGQVAGQWKGHFVGAFLMCNAVVIDQAMAAMLLPGSVAALSYADKVTSIPLMLISTALGTAVLPYASKMIAQDDWDGLASTFQHYLRSIFLSTIPLTLILFLGSHLLVQLLFERGSFTPEDTQIVAHVQALYALQIPFYSACILIVNIIGSMQMSHLLMWGSAWNLVINIVGNFVFIKFLGLSGISLSTSIVYIFSFVYLFHKTNVQLKLRSATKP